MNFNFITHLTNGTPVFLPDPDYGFCSSCHQHGEVYLVSGFQGASLKSELCCLCLCEYFKNRTEAPLNCNVCGCLLSEPFWFPKDITPTRDKAFCWLHQTNLELEDMVKGSAQEELKKKTKRKKKK